MIKYKTVDEFLADQTADKRAQIQMLREIILSSSPKLVEHIKWNAPSYISNGEDRITFNVLNKEGQVKLVFHMGASRKEDKKVAPILANTPAMFQWASDIRGYVTFRSIDDVSKHKVELESLLKDWLAIK